MKFTPSLANGALPLTIPSVIETVPPLIVIVMGILLVVGLTPGTLSLSMSIPLYTPFTALLSVAPPPDPVELPPPPPHAVIRNVRRNNAAGILAALKEIPEIIRIPTPHLAYVYGKPLIRFDSYNNERSPRLKATKCYLPSYAK